MAGPTHQRGSSEGSPNSSDGDNRFSQTSSRNRLEKPQSRDRSCNKDKDFGNSQPFADKPFTSSSKLRTSDLPLLLHESRSHHQPAVKPRPESVHEGRSTIVSPLAPPPTRVAESFRPSTSGGTRIERSLEQGPPRGHQTGTYQRTDRAINSPSNANLQRSFNTQRVARKSAQGSSVERARPAKSDRHQLSKLRCPPSSLHSLRPLELSQGVQFTPQFSTSNASPMADTERIVLRHLSKFRESHAHSVKHILRRQRTVLDREKKSKTTSLSAGVKQLEDPFADMDSIHRIDRGGPCRQEFIAVNQTGPKPGTQSSIRIPVTSYRTTAVKVPMFKEYVHLRESFLKENDDVLPYWPRFKARNDEGRLRGKLDRQFYCLHQHRPLRFIRNEFCRLYTPYVGEILTELNIDWANILYLFLADVGIIEGMFTDDKEFHKILHTFSAQQDPDYFSKVKEKWQGVFSSLPTQNKASLQNAALLSSTFLQFCGFSLWHLARRCDVMKTSSAKRNEPATSQVPHKLPICRVCHQYDCLLHGELLQYPDSEQDTEDESGLEECASPRNAGFDSDYETVINYKRTVRAGSNERGYSQNLGHNKLLSEKATKSYVNKLKKEYKIDWKKQKPFYPCSHDGACSKSNNCRCFQAGIMCEKTCGCSESCKRRFHGCTCQDRCKTSECICQALGRECDADLCKPCGAPQVLDPSNRHKQEIISGKCSNVAMQLNKSPRTLLGQSEVHGFGLFAGESIKADAFVGEYSGELISLSEMTRRNKIYYPQKMSYLFKITLNQDVDAMRAGNKMRFLNNAVESPNCRASVKLCNTVTRIGIFAMRDIEPGNELLFDYAWPENHVNWCQPENTTKPSSGREGNEARTADSATVSGSQDSQMDDWPIEADDEDDGDWEGDYEKKSKGKGRGHGNRTGSVSIARPTSHQHGRPRRNARTRVNYRRSVNDTAHDSSPSVKTLPVAMRKRKRVVENN